MTTLTSPTSPSSAFVQDVEQTLARVGADGWVHARRVGGTSAEQLGFGAETAVYTASVFKTAVLVELYRQVDAGLVDPSERATVTCHNRVMGPLGLSVMVDDVQMSLRDLATLMMSVSDNTATDILLERLGIERVNTSLHDLGLGSTALGVPCAAMLDAIIAELTQRGCTSMEDVLARGPEISRGLRSLDPAEQAHSTPREITRLLELIWTDRVASPTSCAEIRRIMSSQARPNQLRAAVPDGVAYAGKTGSVMCIRNEAGVYTFPDGSSFALAVFTRVPGMQERRPDVEQAITDIGVAALRALGAPGF